MSVELYNSLQAEIARIMVYDSHEHLPSEDEYLDSTLDFVSPLLQYANLDYISAGEQPSKLEELYHPHTALLRKWQIFNSFRPKVINTAYFKIIRETINLLYGVEDITEHSCEIITQKMCKAQKPGRYKDIYDLAKVEYSLVDVCNTHKPNDDHYDSRLFGKVYRIDIWLNPSTYNELGINSLTEAYTAICDLVASLINNGYKGIKLAVAMSRPLSFHNWEKNAINQAFYHFLHDNINPYKLPDNTQPFTDAVVYRFIEEACKNNLIIQFHTGMQSYSNGNPYFLKEIIDTFPEAKLDLFHAGFPYYGELAVLSKFFKNTYADLCWMPWISQQLTKRILSEWLEIVPACKILAFGCDCSFIDMLPGYSKVCRNIITDVLYDKIMSGNLSESDAINTARLILRENLKNLIPG